LLVEVTLSGDESLRPYVLLAPHLGGTGHNNVAQVSLCRGRRVLGAEQGAFGLALAAVTPQQREALRRASAGCVGVSDAGQDLAHKGALTQEYDSAGPANVALCAELERQALTALGFRSASDAAATLALTALSEPFEASWEHQLTDWTRWHASRPAEEALIA